MSGETAASCCCDTGLVWYASLCQENTCMNQCGTQDDPCECAAVLTFCDQYREQQGMPGVLDPTKCYFWMFNGCRYLVEGAVVATCDPTPGPTHNVGSYGGFVDRAPNDPFCETACLDMAAMFNVPPDAWEPQCECGETKTVKWDGGPKCCGCDCEENTCAKNCPPMSITMRLQSWPMGWVYDSSGCTQVVTECVSCKPTGQTPDIPTPLFFNDLIGNNYCDSNCPHNSPCDTSGISCDDGGVGIACSATGQVAFTLQGIPIPDMNFVFGFSVERSCDPADGCADTAWIEGGPNAGLPALCIGDCLGDPGCAPCCFNVDVFPGTSALKLAETINNALGAGSGNCVTYEAEGVQEAWLGGTWACLEDQDGNIPSQNPCHGCLEYPTTWIGPFFSNCSRKATWLYSPTYYYQADASFGCGNFTFFNEDNDRCQCTGSQSGGVGGVFQTQYLAPPLAAEFKYGPPCPDFPPFVAIFSDPCVTVPYFI